MMKKKSSRIIIEKGETLKIEIPAFFDSQKQSLLTIWLLFWSFVGLTVLYEIIFSESKEILQYLLIWLAFWVYFEYKVIRAYRWRKWGKEVLFIENSKLIVSKIIGTRGIPQSYDLSSVRDIEVIKINNLSIVQSLSSAYWNPGKERLKFKFRGKEVLLGMELTDIEANELASVLKHEIKSQLK